MQRLCVVLICNGICYRVIFILRRKGKSIGVNGNLKTFLDEKVHRYNCKEFIKNDPVQFPHAFSEKHDVEIAAFFASVIAWGNRKMIIKSGNKMFHDIMRSRPYDYVMGGEWEHFDVNFNIHRTFFMRDFAYLCRGLKHIYSGYDSLECLFRSSDVWTGIAKFRTELMNANESLPTRHISDPIGKNGRQASACKRLNMMLRWLCRQDGIVDLGIWKDVSPSSLMIPLDVHVARIGRELGLVERKQNDRKTVEQLTGQLSCFSQDDPVKYDFALFGIGVEEKNAGFEI